jgi:hypothetical protein
MKILQKNQTQQTSDDTDCNNKTCWSSEVLMKPCTIYIWGPDCSICDVTKCPPNTTTVYNVWMNCPTISCKNKEPVGPNLTLEDKVLIGCGASTPLLLGVVFGVYLWIKKRTQIIPIEVIKKTQFH